VLLSQAIKQKLRVKSKFYVNSSSSGSEQVRDEDKVKLLMGDHSSAESKSNKGLLGKRKT